jgi:hypothetical protein
VEGLKEARLQRDDLGESDHSGADVLEGLECRPKQNSPVVGHLGLQETIGVGCWYIWWKRREYIKGIQIALVLSLAFSINALTTNLGQQIEKQHQNVWYGVNQ